MSGSSDSLLALFRSAIFGRVIVFDTETTGMSNNDEICQMAAVEYVHGALTRSMDEYLVPSCRMNPWAEEAHGLSMEFLRRNGIHPAIGLGVSWVLSTGAICLSLTIFHLTCEC